MRITGGVDYVEKERNTSVIRVRLSVNWTTAEQFSIQYQTEQTYDRYSSNDWTWSSWVYTDGTYLSQRPRQSVDFDGVTYIYRFY